MTPCPLIEVEGPPEIRGRAYGAAAGERIARGIGHYVEQLARYDVGIAELERLVGDLLPAIEAFDPTYVVEMRAIAKGAEVNPALIVLLNARTEIIKLAQKPELRAALTMAGKADGCTCAVALPAATRGGQLIHAQNWDWKAECAETSVVLSIKREDGPDILTFTEAGALARTGLNAAGIAISANNLECDRDYKRLGVPLALIRRKVLEQSHLALAFHAVYTTPKSAANNMIVSHAQGMALDFECAPDETFIVAPHDDMIIHANHFQSPVALAKLRDLGIASTPDSLYRDTRLRALLDPDRGALTVDMIKAALFDDFASPWSICRPPRQSLSSNLTATVAMLVMQPALGALQVTMLPALQRESQTFKIPLDPINPTGRS